jgi:hypothetical protein
MVAALSVIDYLENSENFHPAAISREAFSDALLAGHDSHEEILEA